MLAQALDIAVVTHVDLLAHRPKQAIFAYQIGRVVDASAKIARLGQMRQQAAKRARQPTPQPRGKQPSEKRPTTPAFVRTMAPSRTSLIAVVIMKINSTFPLPTKLHDY